MRASGCFNFWCFFVYLKLEEKHLNSLWSRLSLGTFTLFFFFFFLGFCLSLFIYSFMYVCLYVWYMYVCMYVYMYVCRYVCIYVCAYIYLFYLYTLAVSPSLGGSRQHKRNKQKQWGFHSVLPAMTRDPAEFGWHCWSNTAHPPPSSTTYVAS